jgi:hypothetical protein
VYNRCYQIVGYKWLREGLSTNLSKVLMSCQEEYGRLLWTEPVVLPWHYWKSDEEILLE